MVRSRKSHEGDEENTKRGTLPPAYSSKVGGNQYVIYVCFPHNGDNLARVLVLSFAELYSANYFTRMLVGPTGAFEDREPFGMRESVVTDLGVIISMYSRENLDNIMNYEPSALELEWQDPDVKRNALHLKYGTWNGRQSEDTDGTEDSGDRPSSPEVERDADLPKAASGARKLRAAKRTGDDDAPRAAKPVLDGFVSAGDIGTQLGQEPRVIRGVLRALKLEKPTHGWSWPKKEAEAIKVQIVAELKKGKKK